MHKPRRNDLSIQSRSSKIRVAPAPTPHPRSLHKHSSPVKACFVNTAVGSRRLTRVLVRAGTNADQIGLPGRRMWHAQFVPTRTTHAVKDGRSSQRPGGEAGRIPTISHCHRRHKHSYTFSPSPCPSRTPALGPWGERLPSRGVRRIQEVLSHGRLALANDRF